MNCKKCKHIKKITGNNNAKCLIHGLSKLCQQLAKITDRDRIKAIKLELRLK